MDLWSAGKEDLTWGSFLKELVCRKSLALKTSRRLWPFSSCQSSWQSQSSQYASKTSKPQQSPPSKSQARLFVSSSQNPSATKSSFKQGPAEISESTIRL